MSLSFLFFKISFTADKDVGKHFNLLSSLLYLLGPADESLCVTPRRWYQPVL